MEASGQFDTSATLPAPGTHYIGSWVGPRVSPGVMVNRKTYCPCRESNSDYSVVQTAA
jgi:hypothetical protein